LATVSDSNLDIVSSLYDAWRSDAPEAAPVAFLDDEFEYVNPPYAVHPGTRHGKDGWIAAIRNLSESFESWGHVPGEMIDAGDRVVVMTTFHACGRGSSVAVEKFEPHIWTLRDGKVIRFEWFNERDEALQAAGLAD
jgi:uncharacterized protein